MEIKLYVMAGLVLSAIVTGFLTVYAWTTFRTRGARSYACLMGSVTIYALGYAFELSNTSLGGMLLASKIQYLGIPYISVFWFMVAAGYAGAGEGIPRSAYPLLFVVPVLTTLLHFTDSWHHLVYKSAVVDALGPFPVLRITRGVWYHVHVIYSHLCLWAGNFLFLRMAYKTVGPYRKQALLLFAISLIPWGADIIYQCNLAPRGVDITVFGFALAGPCMAWGIFRLRIFDLVPIARDVIFDCIRDPVLVFDRVGRLSDYNRAASSIFSFLDERAIGEDGGRLFSGYSGLAGERSPEPGGARDVNIRCHGEVHLYERSEIPIMSRMRRFAGRIIILHEVSEQRELMGQLQELASLDGLSGINNHRHFMELAHKELDRARRHGRPVSMLVADLDLFKQVNDTYGHQAGDEVLRKVARVFVRNLRSSDILGRYGGEEFALLLPETRPDSGRDLAERIRDELSALEFNFDGKKIFVTVSFGISGCDFGAHLDTLPTLFKRADDMLYEAKRSGRNVVVLSPINVV